MPSFLVDVYTGDRHTWTTYLSAATAHDAAEKACDHSLEGDGHSRRLVAKVWRNEFRHGTAHLFYRPIPPQA